MERILAILVDLWVSDKWGQHRTFVLVFGTIVAVALLASIIAMAL